MQNIQQKANTVEQLIQIPEAQFPPDNEVVEEGGRRRSDDREVFWDKKFNKIREKMEFLDENRLVRLNFPINNGIVHAFSHTANA